MFTTLAFWGAAIWGGTGIAVLSYLLGVHSRPYPRRHPGATGVLIELGYIADIPVAYLVDAGDAVAVAKWLAEIREGVAVRV